MILRMLFAAAGLAVGTLAGARGAAGEIAGEIIVEFQQAVGIPPYVDGDSFVDIIVTTPFSARSGTLSIAYDPQDVPEFPLVIAGVDAVYPYESGVGYPLDGTCPDQEGKRTLQLSWSEGSPGNYLAPGRKNPVSILIPRLLNGTCTTLEFREDCLNLIDLADGTSAIPGLHGGQACFTPPGTANLPGDCDNNRSLNVADAICVFGFLFAGSPSRLPCGDGSSNGAGNLTLLDFNGDQSLDITDGIALLRYLFLGGQPHVLGTRCLLIDGCPAQCAPG